MYKPIYDREKVLQLHRDGLKNVDIAAKIGCNPQTVGRILRGAETMTTEYRNPEGYADPTAYRAINPEQEAGEVWIYPKENGEERAVLLLQVFESYSICLMLSENLNAIPEQNEEKLIIKGAPPWVDCGRPQYAYHNRLTRRVGKITLTRVIGIRQKVADIILRGYPGDKPVEPDLTRPEAAQDGFSAEADKIPAETEKPQETPVSGFKTDSADLVRLLVKAEIMEQVAGRLFGILEKQAERG